MVNSDHYGLITLRSKVTMRMIRLGRTLSLLMTSFVILTSMSECKQGDVPLVEYTKYSPVNADINGVSFTSGDYTYLAWGGNPFGFMKYDEGFGFGITRDIVSGDDEVTIHISIREDVPFELNKKYILDNPQNKFGKITFKENGVVYNFISTEGYIIFTDCKGGEDGTSSYILSGCFEFTAVDSEKDLTITVTNGTFENIWT